MSKLPFSERVHNWVQSAVALWPIIIALVGGTVYGNSETVKRWVHGADDIIPSEENFNQQVIHAIEQINGKLNELQEGQARLEAESKKDDSTVRSRLQSQINANKEQIEWLKN